MTEKSGTHVPWTGIAVVGTLLSVTLLPERPFEPMRPPEKERAQGTWVAGSNLEVDARLWEDPFIAARRYEDERAERCKRLKENANEIPPECRRDILRKRRDPSVLLRQLDPGDAATDGKTLIIFALVAGNPFVGAEEGRRRTRYAMLAGLQSSGYVTDNPEQIGILQIPHVPERTTGAATSRPAARAKENDSSKTPQDAPDTDARLTIPYELLSPLPTAAGGTGNPGTHATGGSRCSGSTRTPCRNRASTASPEYSRGCSTARRGRPAWRSSDRRHRMPCGPR